MPQGDGPLFANLAPKLRVFEEFRLPQGLRGIGKDAFEGCRFEETLFLPASLEWIQETAGWVCAGGFEVAEGNEAFREEDGLLMSRDGRRLLALPAYGVEELTIPTGVAEIAPYAARGCRELTRVVLPAGLKRIGKDAFCGCTGLEQLILCAGLEEIGEGAFWGCGRLKGVLLPWGLEAIGESAFSLCGLEEITIPGSVRTVGEAAFASCKLSRVAVEEGVKTLGDGAFEENPGLEAIRLPESLTHLGREAFGSWLDEGEMLIQADEALLEWLTGSQKEPFDRG